MSRPEIEFDKFTSGSYNATNSAGLSRKDIFNRTFFNGLTVFKFKGTKTAFDQHVKNTAGICLGTRPIIVKGVKLNLPVYEEGTNDAAECAIMYVYTNMPEPRPAKTIFSNDVMKALDLVLELLTPNEARAWLEHDTRDKNPLYEQAKQRRAVRWALLGPRTIDTGAEMNEFEKWFNAKLEQAGEAANGPAEKTRVVIDMIANMHVYQAQFGEETNPGGFCAEAAERWNAKLEKKTEKQASPTEGVHGDGAFAHGEQSNPSKFPVTGGKCLGTRTLSVEGATIRFPVHESGSGNAAEYSLMYVASGLPNKIDAARGGSLLLLRSGILAAIKLVLKGLTPYENAAWGALNNLVLLERAEEDKRLNREGQAEAEAKAAKIDALNRWMADKHARLRDAPLTAQGKQRVEMEMLNNWHVYETKFGMERYPGGFVSKTSERWAAKMAEQTKYENGAH